MTDQNKRNDALEPCPFCGGEASKIPDANHSTGWEVGCFSGKCDVESYVWAVHLETAAMQWNTRTLPAVDPTTLTSNPVADSKTADPVVNDPAAIPALQARIEELVEENKELTLQLLATSGQAADALDKLTKAEKNRDGYLAERNKFQLYLQRTHADLELEVAAVDALTAKLAKAVELALEECPFRAGTPKYDKWWHHRRDVLVELEGGSEPDQKQSV